MKFIELVFPDKNPMVVRIESIDSVLFQEKPPGDHKPMLFIKIASWEKPFTYEGDDARVRYDKLKSVLAAPQL